MNTRFLVVDDRKFMRVMLTEILMKLNYEVVGEAHNGTKAIQMYRELQPDVVFMDISMPELDGIEAMKQIRSINPSAIVIICSGASQQYLISDAMKAGANGYVLKPFKPKQINEIIMKHAVTDTLWGTAVEEEAAAGQYMELFTETPGSEFADEQVGAGIEPEPEPHDVIAEAALEEKDDFAAIMKDVISIHKQVLNEAQDIAKVFEKADKLTKEVTIPSEVPLEEKDRVKPEVVILEAQAEAPVNTPPAAEVIPVQPYQNSMQTKEVTGLKEFTSSITCRWKEDFGGQEIIYSAFCYEGEDRVFIDFSNLGETPGYFSFDGLRNLLNWIETKAVPLTNPKKELASHT